MRAGGWLIAVCAVAAACGAPPRVSDAMQAERLGVHMDALQAIADAHGGHRAAFSSGYAASAAYVRDQLEQSGYVVQEQGFLVEIRRVQTASLRRVTPDPLDYTYRDTDGLGFAGWHGTPTSSVRANVVAVDVVVPAAEERNTSTSGCQASDFEGFPVGSIALLQRGSCSYLVKLQRATAAGASAVIVFNEGQPNRQDWIAATLPPTVLPTIPVLGLSYSAGAELVRLAAEGPVELHIDVQSTTEHHADINLIAQSEYGDPHRAVLLGAHLDSVLEGPGINDNASGTALVLEAAIQAAELRIRPHNQLRFAWWGAEEIGLVGSRSYVAERGGDELVYLNFDMVGSVEGRVMHYAGTSAHTSPEVIDERGLHVRNALSEWFDDNQVANAPIGSNFSSDVLGFLEVGVPSGGLFTGAVAPLDPCYHSSCDIRANVNDSLLRDVSAGAAHAMQNLAEHEGEL